MGMSVSINLYGDPLDPGGDVLTLEDGQRFISFRFSPDASVILPGLDREASAGARAIAEACLKLADELDAALDAPSVNGPGAQGAAEP
jgi:hypothetical protein